MSAVGFHKARTTHEKRHLEDPDETISLAQRVQDVQQKTFCERCGENKCACSLREIDRYTMACHLEKVQTLLYAQPLYSLHDWV